MDKKLKYVDHLQKSFANAELKISNIDDFIKNIDGMTGIKTRHFYNNLVGMEDSRYLEIGTWKGSSICSAMLNNQAKILCIDNWSQFSGPKDEFLNNFYHCKGQNDATFMEVDCFQIDVNNIGKYNIYMYDGDHTYEAHYKSLNYFIDCLDDTFIFMIDDWNWEDVRRGTLDSIKNLNLEILWNKEIYTPVQDAANQEWWNGISVFVLKK
jgi:hypothetical protein